MNDRIKAALNFVYSYANHVDDWVTIKKELLKFLNSHDRKLFSTRDNVTKKQVANQLEIEIMSLWSNMTNRNVLFEKGTDVNE